MRAETKATLSTIAIELAIYSCLVTGYFFVTLHLLGGPLKRLFEASSAGYAVVSLALIVGQGILLELLTSALMRRVRPGGR